MDKNLICIICPRGCSLKVQGEIGDLKVTGNACPKGEEYAINECTNPVRTVTSIMRVINREDTMVSVKTATPVKKEDIFSVMDAIRKTSVCAPVRIGDVLIRGIFGTDIIATKNID